MSTAVRNGLRSGATFAVIVIFLALIGFTVIAGTLIGKVFGSNTPANQMPGIPYLVILLVLIALWNGSNAARPDPRGDHLVPAAIAGLAAGAFTGLWVAIYALIMGSLNAQGTDLRPYLSQVSPASNTYFLFKLDTLPAALAHFALFTIAGLAGGLLSYSLRHATWLTGLSNGFQQATSPIRRVTQQVRSMPYAIYVMYALLAVLLFFLPRVWGSYWNYIIGTVGIYVILGLGLNIIVGMAGQLVLGYVAFFAVGAYAMALLTAVQPHNLQWSFWPAALVSILLAAFTGLLLGLPILRLRGDYLAIVTLGFGEIIRNMIRSDLLTPLTAGPRGVRDIAGPSLFGLNLSSDTDFLYLIIVAAALTIFIINRLQNSRAGRAWLAIREDEIAARATGINTFQSKLLALAIGAAFAGLGGALFASRNQFTGPEDHVMMVSINVLALVIVGGMNSIPGIILGAFALKGLPEILRELENYRLMVFGALLVVMMILRPEGLWPTSRPRLEKRSETTPEKVSEPSLAVEPEAEGVKHASKP